MKSRPDFEARYGFVAVMDIKLGKRRSLIKRLADDPVYMEKHGFIKIDKPETPSGLLEESGLAEIFVEEKKKRGRPKKQK
jgi:hypothetical protein